MRGGGPEFREFSSNIYFETLAKLKTSTSTMADVAQTVQSVFNDCQKSFAVHRKALSTLGDALVAADEVNFFVIIFLFFFFAVPGCSFPPVPAWQLPPRPVLGASLVITCVTKLPGPHSNPFMDRNLLHAYTALQSLFFFSSIFVRIARGSARSSRAFVFCFS